MAIEDLIVVGDRINPGFRSTKKIIEAEDMDALQALARRQVESGAHYLDITVGPRGYTDAKFLTEVIHVLQDAVDVPLCFDYPSVEVQEVCLKAYDLAKAGGRRPLVNSIAETRLEIIGLMKICPFQVIVMTSEYLADGTPQMTKHARDVVGVAQRIGGKLIREHKFSPDDIFIDVTINSMISDMEGLTKMALDAIGQIRQDSVLKDVHIMGGLTNLGNMLPSKEYDGVRLRLMMERAFLTVAIPLGFDTVMATPWHDYQALPSDHEVLLAFKEVSELTGMDAMRRLRKLWAS